jgi:phosphoribosylformylglycinamidine cyclo-ligase
VSERTQITYAQAGVDVEAGDKAVELMKADVRRATRPEVLGGLGGFAGLFDASSLAAMSRPVLATSTDGVGTKVAIAPSASTSSAWWSTTSSSVAPSPFS